MSLKDWINADESAKEMLARVLTERPLLLLPPLHRVPLRVGNVVEIVGPSPSAKSHILLHAAVNCILPKEWNGVHYGGLERLVMYFDLDCRFDILRLSQLLRNRIVMASGLSSKVISEPYKDLHNYNMMVAQAADLDEELFGACMRRFLYIRCYDSFEFLASLKTMRYQLQKESEAHGGGVHFLMIDSISAFYWVDRSSKPLAQLGDNRKHISLQSLAETVVQEIRKLLQVQPMLVLATKADMFGNASTNELKRKLYLDKSVDLKAVAASCNGYVGADLEALCREASMSALHRSSVTNGSDAVSVTMDDWKHARSIVRPSITRGITVEIPKVSWEDIGGLKDLKKKLQQAVEWPIKHAAAFARLGIEPVRGILLHGPPGCSKTTLAKAAAHAAQAAFFSLSGADLYSMYVGEGEALLRSIFQRARLAAPSIIFFDEADVVASKRGGSSRGSSVVADRLLSTLLTEMDGLEQAKGILVLAATNRPDAIDAAAMRPGRFDLVLYVSPPDLEGREEILRVHTRRMKLGEDVDLQRLAEDTDLFTGAELAGLCNEAGMIALREDMSATAVFDRHFWTARKSLRPALTASQIDTYKSFMKTLKRR